MSNKPSKQEDKITEIVDLIFLAGEAESKKNCMLLNEEIRNLIQEESIDVNLKAEDGETLLHYAVVFDNPPLVEILLTCLLHDHRLFLEPL